MSLQIVKCKNKECGHEFPTKKTGKTQCGKCGKEFEI